jgi:hypothetical protein
VNAQVERMVSIVKMATVLKECTDKEQCSAVRFLWLKRLTAKFIHKGLFPVYSEKHLSCKVFHNWVEHILLMTKRLKRRCRSGCDNSKKKRLLCCGFERTGSDRTSISMLVEDM